MSNSYDNDVMLDLETTGISAGCCVLSIGACTLDRKFSIYLGISHESCLDYALRDAQSTMDWWDKQPAAAYGEAFSGTLSLPEALTKFNAWLSSVKPQRIWGNGAAFDLPILGTAYEAAAMTPAWPRFSDRCYRTMKDIYSGVPKPPFVGVKHNALADARFQAEHLYTILEIHDYAKS